MKGLSYPIYSVGAVNSLLFGAYVKSLEMIRGTDSSSPPSYTEILLAGGISGAAQLTIACPVDLIKVRLQSAKGDICVVLDFFIIYKILLGFNLKN